MSLLRRLALLLSAPLLALLISALVTSLVLLAAGDSPSAFWDVMLTPPGHRNLVNIFNNGAILYLSGMAAAIGFRMNLFNIGVEGQYRVATIVGIIVVAMVAGAFWAGIAGLLKVTRGVSEVISTIMLNAIAISATAYLLRRTGTRQGQTIETDHLPRSSWVGGIGIFSDSPTDLYGMAFLAVAVGLLFWLIIGYTRFGFDLRATGQSETAAVASGVDVRRMVLVSMLLSGAVAGLIGLPYLFGDSHNFGSTIQAGIGFSGIAVALLGRNHPFGVALGALVFAWLNEQANPLGILADISNDIIFVTQGVVVLSVVVAYAVVERYNQRLEQREVAAALESAGLAEEARA